MERMKGFITLMRVRYTAQVVCIVVLLSLKSGGVSSQSMFAIASFLFLSIALFCVDDAYDNIGDLIIHPKRPIPRKIFTVNQVYLIGAILFCFGTLSVLSLMTHQIILYFIAAVLGFSVVILKLSSIWKATLTASMIFILFPFSTDIHLKTLLFGLMVSLPHFAGSISKDFIHWAGDEKIGLEHPKEWLRYLASFTFFINSLIILTPIILNIVPWSYFPMSLPTIVSCLVLGKKILNKKYQKVYIWGGIGMISSLLFISINI